MILRWNENHCQLVSEAARVGAVLVVNRFRVAEDDAAAFRGDLQAALAVLAQQRGVRRRARLGRNVDDPTLWVLVTRWQDVGSYRRALSSYDVKVSAVPLLSPGRSTSPRPTSPSTASSPSERRRCRASWVDPRSVGWRFARRSQPAGHPMSTGAPPWPSRPPPTVDNVVSLAKRRGFVFPCGEIYGGTRSAWDYGPLGVELKENIKRQWWRSMVQSPRRRRRPRLLGDPAARRSGRPPATSRPSPTR